MPRKGTATAACNAGCTIRATGPGSVAIPTPRKGVAGLRPGCEVPHRSPQGPPAPRLKALPAPPKGAPRAPSPERQQRGTPLGAGHRQLQCSPNAHPSGPQPRHSRQHHLPKPPAWRSYAPPGTQPRARAPPNALLRPWIRLPRPGGDRRGPGATLRRCAGKPPQMMPVPRAAAPPTSQPRPAASPKPWTPSARPRGAKPRSGPRHRPRGLSSRSRKPERGAPRDRRRPPRDR
mmetsp:Transcript_99834/g.213772  ORF Transcript_99834/g.213772 Transcript_99834/m.213772 type:complete len:233 (+) Transcript_99834:518-1216(+)